MLKREARALAKSAVKAMSLVEREWASGAIADALSSLDSFRFAKKPFIFLGTDSEPDTEEIVGLALMLERSVSVPRVTGQDMQAVTISPYTLFRKNRWGILEPHGGQLTDDIDLAIVPMVAFDGLMRVGHGGGYYDKFLEKHDCIKIGIAFDCQQVEGVISDSFDIAMDMIVTEKRIIIPDGTKTNEFYLNGIKDVLDI